MAMAPVGTSCLVQAPQMLGQLLLLLLQRFHDLFQVLLGLVNLSMVHLRHNTFRFNLGEATLTRCIARITIGGHTTAGVGHVLGRDDGRARWIAQLDALLQQPTLHDALQHEVIVPLKAAREQVLAAERARHAASRVSFYTLKPEVSA